MRIRGRAPARCRTWSLRAGAALACLVAAAAAPAPASAAPQETATPAAAQSMASILSLSPARLSSGETATLSYVVTAFPPGGNDVGARVEVGDGVRCAGDCEVDEAGRFEARLTAPDVPAGETRTIAVAVVAGNRAARALTVVGPERVRTVRRVSGRVTDSESGEGIGGAQVFLRDGAGRTHETRTGGGGRFAFEGGARLPIAPGSLRLAAQADDYSRAGSTVPVSDGGAASGIVLALRPDSRPTPTPTPSAEPSPSEAASAPAEDEAAAAPPPAEVEPEAASDSSTLFWVSILVGVLMLALGVGGAVLLLVRRRQDRAADGAERGAPAPPRYPALDDATAIVNHPIAGADPLANAPTVVQPAIRDEYADPYGLPPGQPYGSAGSWGAGPPHPDTSRVPGPSYPDATQVAGPDGARDATRVGPGDATRFGRPADALEATQISGPAPFGAPTPHADPRGSAPGGGHPFAGGRPDRMGDPAAPPFDPAGGAPAPFAGGVAGPSGGFPGLAATAATPAGYAGLDGVPPRGGHPADAAGGTALPGLNPAHGPGAYARLDTPRDDIGRDAGDPLAEDRPLAGRTAAENRPFAGLAAHEDHAYRGLGLGPDPGHHGVATAAPERRPGLDDTRGDGDAGERPDGVGAPLPRRGPAGATGSTGSTGGGSDGGMGGTFHAFGPPTRTPHPPAAPTAHAPAPSPYVPAGAPRPTGSSAR
ncbi:MAG TPA: carboxypeptidase regulatory-like domain-containing protein, partial [Pilimelia sp.]|nr:carboxypeptidase regulatory-like domain-containing protein [Pilimelia sp.]